MIELQTDLMTSSPVVLGVESEIRDALTNLIFNAVDAMSEGGVLTVRTRRLSTQERVEGSPKEAALTKAVCLEVTDTGIGMDEETRRRCVEPFFTTKGERGTGMGLAMVYGMVERHGAELDIDSRPGQGTTVRVLFPSTVGPADETGLQLALALPQRSLRILIVDDDPLVIESLRESLRNDGHSVVAADGGQAGIDAFHAAQQRSEPFEVVITDLGMPYVDGRRVAAGVKGSAPSTPVILLTGWGQRLIAEGENPAHVDRILNKPPKLRDLRLALAELCARPARV